MFNQKMGTAGVAVVVEKQQVFVEAVILNALNFRLKNQFYWLIVGHMIFRNMLKQNYAEYRIGQQFSGMFILEMLLLNG